MKKITALLGLVGAVVMYTACSTDTVSGPMDDNAQSTDSSSSVATDSGDKSSNSSRPEVKDSIVHQTVIITSSGSRVVPYSSSAQVFCWTEKCEKEYANVTPQSSSSISIQVTMSSEAQMPQLPPIVSGNTMTDQRDNKTYKLERVAGLLWMAENINLELKSGYYCTLEGDENNYCDTYGGYYTFAAAKRACPEGWRLPSYEEISKAHEATDEDFWTLGGRFKLEKGVEFGQTKEQGYVWLEDSEYNNVQIQKSNPLKPLVASERAYNIRCVSDQ